MSQTGKKDKVILKRTSDYNPLKIQSIISSGLKEFNLTSKISGRITIKPNIVLAHHKVAPSAYTRPEFIDGLLSALEEHDAGISSLTIAEKTGVGLPTTCAHILNLNPWKIDHLRLAHERGYGPLDLKDIELKGDVSLEEIQKKTKN